MSSPVSSVTSQTSSTAATSTATKLPAQVLGQDDFLKLLVTQMTSQDPLNPTTDTQMVAQMAQFSALEESKAMEGDLSTLSTQQQFTQAASLLGSTVLVQTGTNTTAQGVVSAVQFNSGTPALVVNGQSYSLSQVLSVTPTASGQ